MTPFAALGHAEKRASDLFSTGNAWGDAGLDIAAGSNPFTGVPYYGAKMLDDYGRGMWNMGKGVLTGDMSTFKSGIKSNLSGMANGAWGALSFLGGAALGKGALKLGGKLFGKGVAARGAQMATNAGTAVNAAAQGTGAAATAARGVQGYGNMISKGIGAADSQMANMGNRIAHWRRPSMNGMTPLGQSGGKAVATAGVTTGAALAAPSNATKATAAAPAIPKPTPAAPNAPSWYSAVTGNAAVPQYT